MKNVTLGRAVLDHVTEHPEEFSMRTFGRKSQCGTAACLAGRALLLSGYTLNSRDDFIDRSRRVVASPAMQAFELLGLTVEEFTGLPGERPIFDGGLRDDDAIERFRVIVEKAEAEAGQ